MENFPFAVSFLLINTRVQKVNPGLFLFSSFKQQPLIKAETLLDLISPYNSSWEEKGGKGREESVMKTTPAPNSTRPSSDYRKTMQGRGATKN